MAAKTNTHKRAIALFLLALLCLLPSIIFPFRLWDDVAMYLGSPSAIEHSFQSAGLGYFVPVYEMLIALELSSTRVVAPAVIGVAFAATAPVIYLTLRQLWVFDDQSAFWIAALTSLAPLNFSKPLLTPLVYNFSFIAFVFSTFALVGAVKRQSVILRLLALFGFGFCYLTASFAPLALCVFLVLAVLNYDRTKYPTLTLSSLTTNLVSTLTRYIDFVLLPFIIYSLKLLLLSPYDIYRNYNSVSLGALLDVFPRFVDWLLLFLSSFADLTVEIVELFGIWNVVIFSVFAFFLYRAARWQNDSLGPDKSKALYIHALVAVLLIFTSVLAYLAVNKYAVFQDWHMRHQVVLQLVAGYAIWVFILLVAPRRFRFSIFVFVAAWFATTTFASFLALHRDGHLQAARMIALAEDPNVQAAHTIGIHDIAAHENFLDRHLRFYEWPEVNAIAGPPVRAFQTLDESGSLDLEEIRRRFRWHCRVVDEQYDHYGVSGWEPDGNLLLLKLQLPVGGSSLGFLWTVTNTARLLIDKDKHSAALRGVVGVEKTGLLTDVGEICAR